MPVHRHCRRHAILSWWPREHGSVFLQTRNFLAAPFFSRGRPTRWVTLGGRAPWRQSAVLVRRWWRRSVSYVTRSWRRARQ